MSKIVRKLRQKVNPLAWGDKTCGIGSQVRGQGRGDFGMKLKLRESKSIEN